MRISLVLSLLAALASSCAAAAEEMKPPRLSSADVDWTAALSTLADSDLLRPMALRPARAGGSRTVSATLDRLNTVMSQRFAGVAISPVPVLLPFNTEALLRDQAEGAAVEGDERYLSGFHASKFFYPGLSGYDAAFAVRTSEVPELADIKFPEPIQVQISGSALLYELDPPVTSNGTPVPALEAEFPGIQRMILEHHLRYTFVRFGVPYVVSVICFDGGVARFKLPTCRAADQVAQRFLRALRVAGGTPQLRRPVELLPVERPVELSSTFSYHGPGRLLPNTSFRGQSGRADYTVYSQIRFPLSETPAFVNSQMFQSRNKGPVSEPGGSPNYSYPWRDNFCERRGFEVGQCPAGIGHQGQDLRPALCKPAPGMDRCDPAHEVVAARGGVVLRTLRQEAAYLFVNSATEHIRFRYLHMNPRKMDDDQLLSGRRVHEGEVIGHVSNFHKKEGGTSYHLHFDIQVPTKDGWVFVNPYMTLVSAYERLIGERGEEIAVPSLVASADPVATGSLGTPALVAEPQAVKNPVKHAANKTQKKSKLSRHAKSHKHTPVKRKKHRIAHY